MKAFTQHKIQANMKDVGIGYFILYGIFVRVTIVDEM